MSNAQHDGSSALDGDISFSLNTHEASAAEPGLVTKDTTPVSPGVPPTSTLKRTNDAAFLNMSMQSHCDQIEGDESSDVNTRLDPRSVRPPWYDPANYPLRQPPPRRRFYGLIEEEDSRSCSGGSHSWRLREDPDGDLRLWTGKMGGNREVYDLYEWSLDREGKKIPRRIGWWDEDGTLSLGSTLQLQGGIMKDNSYAVLIRETQALCRELRRRRRRTRARMRTRVVGRL